MRKISNMKSNIALAALLIFSQSAISQSGSLLPLELKGIQLGESTLSDVEAKFPGAMNLSTSVLVSPESVVNKQCGYSYTNTECRVKAYELLSVAGSAAGSYFFHAVAGKVEGINVTFNKDDFLIVREALAIKYGAPSGRKTDELKNRAGASFQSETFIWSRPDGEIRISEIGSKITESRLTMYSRKYQAHIVEDAKKRAHDGAKNL